MAKQRSAWFCKNCGNESPKWVGKCNSCGEWNSYIEELKQQSKNKLLGATPEGGANNPLLLSQISDEQRERISTSIEELDRVLGGGLVPGSLTLLGGDPGIGKSTLVLQLALNIRGRKVLYISGEESVEQLKLRANRLAVPSETCYFLSETSLERSFRHIKNLTPEVIIFDSIQTMASDSLDASPGSVGQVRECAAAVLRLAKQTNTPVILIGHITKEGALAGPKVLEHIVDTVLQFEGDKHYMYRILRSIKNRFGTTAELGIFEMQETGLREISNPSELLLSENKESLSGVSIAASVEGNRPLLIETQALVSSAVYGTPQRSATGFDLRRLNMLLAVLEKRAGFKLSVKDVFLNIAGGIKVNDPAVDLAVISAILSSNVDAPLSKTVCMAGEVGLSGEVRAVTKLEQRIKEADKLGFKSIVVPEFGSKNLVLPKGLSIQVIKVSRVDQAFKHILR